jgi:2-C-methyl-D-erythritol 4-phosphate cytidylyltransferase / 2-C-methyl-D-erythritol 2,4-cyclodiphosphate synthase
MVCCNAIKIKGLTLRTHPGAIPSMSLYRIAAIIVAAGRGNRAGGTIPKQFVSLHGRTVLRRAVDAFLASGRIGRLIVVIHPDDQTLANLALQSVPEVLTAPGGASRQTSVRAGLEALTDWRPDLVLIHDAARPLVDIETIGAVVDALKSHDGAIAAAPVTDTLKSARDGLATGTVSRDGLWRAQTPQGFRFDKILEAHRVFANEDVTDDAALAEHAGLRVAIVPSPAANLKLTVPEDFAMAEALLSARLGDIRTGSGFDVHRFGPGDHVWLCGVKLPYSAGLVGHSDADVGLHALTDAILGAIGAGDIGVHFPPSDPKWRNAASNQFLTHAAALVRAKDGVVANVDVTLICEAPKIGPHRDAMRARIADILEIAHERVSVKATTTETLGFTGRREGVAAQAIATIRLPL